MINRFNTEINLSNNHYVYLVIGTIIILGPRISFLISSGTRSLFFFLLNPNLDRNRKFAWEALDLISSLASCIQKIMLRQ